MVVAGAEIRSDMMETSDHDQYHQHGPREYEDSTTEVMLSIVCTTNTCELTYHRVMMLECTML